MLLTFTGRCDNTHCDMTVGLSSLVNQILYRGDYVRDYLTMIEDHNLEYRVLHQRMQDDKAAMMNLERCARIFPYITMLESFSHVGLCGAGTLSSPLLTIGFRSGTRVPAATNTKIFLSRVIRLEFRPFNLCPIRIQRFFSAAWGVKRRGFHKPFPNDLLLL